MKTIHQNYSKSRCFKDFIDVIEEIFEIENFCELNIAFIREMMKIFKIETDVHLMSELLETSFKNNDLLIEIGKQLGCSTYLSGKGASKYNDAEKFKINGIKLEYQQFESPVYEQMFSPFVSNLSILDLLFNEGQNGAKFIDNC
jgi:cephalosporin hydroxylase